MTLKLSRRKFIKSSLIGLGCIILPTKVVKTKSLTDLHQFYVSFETTLNENKAAKVEYTERYLKPSLATLNGFYNEHKEKGYISCPTPKNSKCILPFTEIKYFKYKDMFIRYIIKLYNVEYDLYLSRLDMFMGKVV